MIVVDEQFVSAFKPTCSNTFDMEINVIISEMFFET